MAGIETTRWRFSTEGIFTGLPPEQAARAWREFFVEHFSNVELDVPDDIPFQGFIQGVAIGQGVNISDVAINAKRAARTNATIAADCKDHLALVINTTGVRCSIRQRGQDLVLDPGAVTLYAYGIPGEFVDMPSAPFHHIGFDPRMLSGRVKNLDDLVAQTVHGNVEALRLLRIYSGLLTDRNQGLNVPLADVVAAHIIDLVALMLGTGRDSAVHAQEHGLRAARLAAVLHHVATEYSDARLSAATVAARLGVTPRYVHLLLDESGNNFSQHLMERRLTAALDLLADPKKLHLKISDIAYAVGFTDVSHFNRSFRARYGLTPSDVRARAMSVRTADE
jgi:AraC-like DNA-binding protein